MPTHADIAPSESKCPVGQSKAKWRLRGRIRGVKNKRPHSAEYREKKRQEQIRWHQSNPGYFAKENNPNWRGGITAPHRRRLLTWRWRDISAAVIARDGKCCCCGSTQQLHAHHKIPWRFSKDDSMENLIAVCNKCHHGLEARAYDSMLEAAIIKYCHRCSAIRRADVRDCTADTCPLWHFRPFKP